MPNAEISSFNVPVVQNGTTVNVTYDFKDAVARANTPVVDSALDDASENPVQNQAITVALTNKVDKVTGKQLSTEDFTSAEKTKLAELNNYSGLIYFSSSSSDTASITIPSGTASGKNNFMQLPFTLVSNDLVALCVSTSNGLYRMPIVIANYDPTHFVCIQVLNEEYNTVAYIRAIMNQNDKINIQTYKMTTTAEVEVKVHRLKIK